MAPRRSEAAAASHSLAEQLRTSGATDPAPRPSSGRASRYGRGLLAIANAGPNTNGSQFFVVYGDSALRPIYTVFGKVSPAGLAILDKVAAGGIEPTAEETGTGRRHTRTTEVRHLEILQPVRRLAARSRRWWRAHPRMPAPVSRPGSRRSDRRCGRGPAGCRGCRSGHRR
ncbi:peptidylprolyl isomerase [Streptomyces sp. NPDC047972]|uniref:peptidylprolyl isomerase n=1 Tax=Streptomyces sp. NPDC047972 TaxID=3365493 RepID=UPI003722AB84